MSGDIVQQAADVIASATGNGFTSSTVGSHIIAEALAAAGLLVDPAASVCTPEQADWTAGPDGGCNNSPLYEALVTEVARLIRNDAHALLGGRAESTAGLILAQLAHIHHFGPLAATEVPS